MKSTGIVRRIDELGRIVIPKEIRKGLGIREGENLEIIVDEKKIILEKNSPLIKVDNLIEKLSNLLTELTTDLYMITDREKVICSNKKELINNNIKSFINFIDNRESQLSEKLEKYVIEDEEIIGYFSINPIISLSDCFGLIILVSKDNQKKENDLLGKFVAKIIINKLDIC